MTHSVRLCPLCGNGSKGRGFPFAIDFAGHRFDYERCSSCFTVYVNPVPGDDLFQQMYSKLSYHDEHYSAKDARTYEAAAALLRKHARPEASVLDYGCGFGAFLKAARLAGFDVEGVEYDANAAAFAAAESGCRVVTVSDYAKGALKKQYEVIHLGDVLVHLVHPAEVLRDILKRLRPNGLLFVEGPIETNPSLVYWTAVSFGSLKRTLTRDSLRPGIPTHLFRTDGPQQFAFFRRVEPRLSSVHWEITEDGWPYSEGGLIKKTIAGAAMLLGGKSVLGCTFGNRFCGIFRLNTA